MINASVNDFLYKFYRILKATKYTYQIPLSFPLYIRAAQFNIVFLSLFTVRDLISIISQKKRVYVANALCYTTP